MSHIQQIPAHKLLSDMLSQQQQQMREKSREKVNMTSIVARQTCFATSHKSVRSLSCVTNPAHRWSWSGFIGMRGSGWSPRRNHHSIRNSMLHCTTSQRCQRKQPRTRTLGALMVVWVCMHRGRGRRHGRTRACSVRWCRIRMRRLHILC